MVVLNGAVPDFFSSGSGSGSGYGYGYGYGSGSGDDEKSYWLAASTSYAAMWPEQQQQRLLDARAAGLTIAYWKSDEYGCAVNGGHNKPVSAGLIETVAGPLELCSGRALHGTLLPPKWEGKRMWIVALHGEVADGDDKLGALKREIIGECLQ